MGGGAWMDVGRLSWLLAAALIAVSAGATLMSIRHSRKQRSVYRWPPAAPVRGNEIAAVELPADAVAPVEPADTDGPS